MKSIKKYETIINEALRSALEYDTPEGQINEFISFFGKHIGSDRIYIFEDDEEHHEQIILMNGVQKELLRRLSICRV